jgi:DNA-binding transcriptional regulator LsrR (DeoR family)
MASPRAKLTEDDVLEIRRLYAVGDCTQGELAERFDVAQATIHRVVRRRNWRNIP